MANLVRRLLSSFASGRFAPPLQGPSRTPQKRLYSSRNPLERRTAREIYESLTGGEGGRKGRGQKWKGIKWVQIPREIRIGPGKKGQRWPGLNYPLPSSGTNLDPWARKEYLGPRVATPEDELIMKDLGMVKLRELQGEVYKGRSLPESNWSRKGWSGKTWKGRYVGMPETPDGTPIFGFHCILLDIRRVRWMTSSGSKMATKCLVITGNTKGMVGCAIGLGSARAAAIRKAKNRAVKNLRHIPICEGRTIYHNISSKCVRSRVMMERAVRGYGLRCNPTLQAVMQMIGIKDIRIKLTGSEYKANVIEAVIKGLVKQETYESVASDAGRYLVQHRTELSGRPLVVGVPSNANNSFLVWLREHQMLHPDLENKLFPDNNNNDNNNNNKYQ